MERKRIRKIVKSGAVIIVLVLIWQIVSLLHLWSEYVFPSPGKVFFTLLDMIGSGEMFSHILASMQRVILGYAIAFTIAFVLGILTGIKPKWEEVYHPLIEFMRNVPPLSLIPLLILWFGIGEMTKVIIIILASFFPMFLNIRKGVLSCDTRLLEVGKSFGFSKKDEFFRIVLPHAVPDILLGMKTGLGYSFRAIIGAEMIAATKGIGYYILDAQLLARSDKIIAGILVIGMMGYFMDKIFGWCIRKGLRGGVDNRWY